MGRGNQKKEQEEITHFALISILAHNLLSLISLSFASFSGEISLSFADWTEYAVGHKIWAWIVSSNGLLRRWGEN